MNSANGFINTLYELMDKQVKVNIFFDYCALYRYNEMLWTPEEYRDKVPPDLYTMLIAIEEITEVETAYLHGKNIDQLEELSDYYMLVKVLCLANGHKLEPQIPINFRVNDLAVIKKLTKAIRYGFNRDTFIMAQHYYLQYFDKKYFAYPGIRSHNVTFVLMMMNLIKSIQRYYYYNNVTSITKKEFMSKMYSYLMKEGRKYLSHGVLSDLDSIWKTKHSVVKS
jgi:hypothetical protein